MNIKKAVIPAAGLGTRMLPLTRDTIPKEMLPIAQKPMIRYSVEEAVDSGIETIIIIISSEKELIKKCLKSISSKAELIFLYQNEPKGLADAINISKEIVKDDPFALLLPDNIFFSNVLPLNSLSMVFNRYKKDVGALMEICPEEFKLFGNCGKVELEKIDDRVFSIKEIKDKERGCFNPLKKATDKAGGIIPPAANPAEVFISNRTSASLTGYKSDSPGSIGSISSTGSIIRGFARHILFPHFFDYIERTRSNSGKELDDVPVFQLMQSEKGVLGYLLEGKGFDTGNPLGYQAANEFAQINVSKPTT